MAERDPIIVYGVGSPNVTKVAIMLEEVEQPYELRFVSVFEGEQFTPAFLARNPLGKVPVIEDPALGRPLAESGAILIWLAERSGRLLPERSADRYEVLQWLMIQMSSIGPMLGQLNHFRLLPAGSDPYALARYETSARRLYKLLDERLADRPWIAGGAYSIADVATFPWAEYLERHAFDPGAYPDMLRWRSAIASRPAVIRARERMAMAFDERTQETLQSARPEDLDRFFGRTADMPARDFSAVTKLR